MVAQIIFVTLRARKDIKMAISFIYNQLRIPDKYIWGDLVRVIRYIVGTLHLPLIIRADSLSVIKWWVYASFVANPYCKRHTVEIMYMGSGLIMDPSRKKKINGKISTEAEMVIEDNDLPKCLWLIYFIEGQVYVVEELQFHQDNISDILMGKNGKYSRKN